jgi:hypothetical protein
MSVKHFLNHCYHENLITAGFIFIAAFHSCFCHCSTSATRAYFHINKSNRIYTLKIIIKKIFNIVKQILQIFNKYILLNGS